MPNLITMPSSDHAALVEAINKASSYVPQHLKSALLSSATFTEAEMGAFFPVLQSAAENAWSAGDACAASALWMAVARTWSVQ
ncbi:hypothetical protein [Caudoviricetes sp.]|nr:hypothetical protein [Caudoviricetes sp.]